MKKLIVTLIMIAIASAGVNVTAQKLSRKEIKAERKLATAQMVDSLLGVREFIFVADRAVSNLPAKPYITLNGGDEIIVGKDQIQSHLPFYGRLYSAPMNSTTSPLSFDSKDFTYTVLSNGEKKNLIKIELKHSSWLVNYTIVFEVFDNATAVANITMSNGSSSMFFGYIKPKISKK